MTEDELKVIKAVANFHKKKVTCPFCNRLEFKDNDILTPRKHRKNCPTLIALRIMKYKI